MKYLQVQDKLYEVISISFFYMTVEAIETDLAVRDAPEDEIFGLDFFKDYKIGLVNKSGGAEVVDFEEWKFNNGIHV